MQTHPGQCSPESVRRLQRIFDAIWHRLETSGSRHTFPWDAQASREKIAVQLCRHMNDRIIDAERIEQDVFEMFDESGRWKAFRRKAQKSAVGHLASQQGVQRMVSRI